MHLTVRQEFDYRHSWALFGSLPEARITGADSCDFVLRRDLESRRVTFARQAIQE
jgi:hypothetical protein